MPNNNNLSEIDINILKNIVKYISHCTLPGTIEPILKDKKLKIVNIPKDETGSKVFGKIIDKYSSTRNNTFCGNYFTVELQLNYKILIEHKYYVIYNGGTYGHLVSAGYISDHLFQIIKKCDFDRNKFVEQLKKEDMPELTRQILTEESEHLFMSDVVKNKYNPPINYLILKDIAYNIENEKKVHEAYHFTETIGFLDDIPLKKYLNQFAF